MPVSYPSIYGQTFGLSHRSPIHTYQGDGCEKNGCCPEMHAIVHLEREQPHYTRKEVERGLKPSPAIRITPREGVTLDPMSRVNFGRVHTVEHNVAVMNIGHIPRNTHSYNFLIERWEAAKAQSRSNRSNSGSNIPTVSQQYLNASQAGPSSGSYSITPNSSTSSRGPSSSYNKSSKGHHKKDSGYYQK